MRSLLPFPKRRANESSMSRSAKERPQTSEIRAPVAYKNSTSARSRRANESSPVIAAISRVTSSSRNGFGKPLGTLTPSTSAAGSSARSDSTARYLCSIRTAANCRATDLAALPLLRRCATNASTSLLLADNDEVSRVASHASYSRKSRR